MTVYLVGAGPGDPGLLTVRAAEVLAAAEVVVYDRLSVGAAFDLVQPTAERVNVGKTPGGPSTPQAEINDLLVSLGRAGREVVRLKGGDPFVFARGGEELDALLRAGVDVEVVPGITSALAAPAYAGIPVTLRHSSTSVTVVTGHEDPDTGGSVDWEAVARVGGTIVILMGVGRLPAIVGRLRAGGLGGDTPVAVVRWGTRPQQHAQRATLDTVLDLDLAAPSVIVVGAVAALDLGWFESRPLFGRRVVVTRTRAQAGSLSRLLRRAGAEPIEVPVLRIDEPADGGAALQQALTAERRHDWLVVTSPNGAARVLAAARDARAFGGMRIAAIGPGTADALRVGNLEADLVPERYVAESLVEAFPAPPGGVGRVLLARAAAARDVLPEGLRAKGWEVDVVEAYRTVPVEPDAASRHAVASADAITFTSSSTVTNFLDGLGAEAVPPLVACIGPVTAATARAAGLEVAVEAEEHTVPGLVRALEAHLAGNAVGDGGSGP